MSRMAVFKHVEPRVVVCRGNADRAVEAGQAARRRKLVAPEPAVAQGFAKRLAAVRAPFLARRVVDEGVGAATARGDQVVGGRRADVTCRVADENDVLLTRRKVRVVKIHHDGRGIRLGQQRSRRFRVRNRDDVAVESFLKRLSDACGGELRRRAHERNVPVVLLPEMAKNTAELVLPRNASHAKSDEHFLSHAAIIADFAEKVCFLCRKTNGVFPRSKCIMTGEWKPHGERNADEQIDKMEEDGRRRL